MKNIEIYSLIAAYLYIILAIVISKITGIKKEKMIFLSGFRMTVQLLLMAYILQFVFKNPSPIYTIIIIIIMEAFAIYNIFKRTNIKTRNFKEFIAISMFTGSIICIIYFIFVIIAVKPWYSPEYFVTLGGMFIGNTMTALTLAINNFIENLKSEKTKIQNALMLGATPKVAISKVVKSSFNAAIIPTMNSMLGMGIVFLPGMMAGQIISGQPPFESIIYQITIMLGVLGSVVLSVFILFSLSQRIIFNKDAQLQLDELS